MGRILCPLLTSQSTDCVAANRPAFQASLTHGYASEISPNKGRSCCQEHVICPCPSATSTSAHSSGSVSLSAASSPGVVGLYVVSVRHLAGLGENVADDELPRIPVRFSYRRTARSSSDSQLYEHIRRLPPHGSLPPRSCPHLVLTSMGYPFGIMTPTKVTGTKYRGLSPHKITPMLGVLHRRTGGQFLRMDAQLPVLGDR